MSNQTGAQTPKSVSSGTLTPNQDEFEEQQQHHRHDNNSRHQNQHQKAKHQKHRQQGHQKQGNYLEGSEEHDSYSQHEAMKKQQVMLREQKRKITQAKQDLQTSVIGKNRAQIHFINSVTEKNNEAARLFRQKQKEAEQQLEESDELGGLLDFYEFKPKRKKRRRFRKDRPHQGHPHKYDNN